MRDLKKSRATPLSELTSRFNKSRERPVSRRTANFVHARLPQAGYLEEDQYRTSQEKMTVAWCRNKFICQLAVTGSRKFRTASCSLPLL